CRGGARTIQHSLLASRQVAHLTLSQLHCLPDRYGASRRLDTTPSSPKRSAAAFAAPISFSSRALRQIAPVVVQEIEEQAINRPQFAMRSDLRTRQPRRAQHEDRTATIRRYQTVASAEAVSPPASELAIYLCRDPIDFRHVIDV